MLDVLLDAVLDSLKTLPFLFGAFLLMEAAEKHYGKHMDTILKKSKWGGPLAGSILGCIPQCGFSVIASNLYAGGLITLGTLLSVYLSTSDEAIILLLADSSRGKRYPEAHGHEGHHRYHRRLSRGSDLLQTAPGTEYGSDLFRLPL